MYPVENVGHGAEPVNPNWENPDKLSISESGNSAVALGTTADQRLSAGDLLLVVCSPKAGAGGSEDRIDRFCDRIKQYGLEVVCDTDITAVEKRVSGEMAAGRRLCVAAAGGDGTLNLLASVLGPGVPLMPFPMGTENLVARNYGLLGEAGEFDIDVAVETVLNGRNHLVDAGIATFIRRNGTRRNKMFLVMATVGFDAEVVRRMHLTRKGHISRWSYLKPILAVLRRYRYPRIFVQWSGQNADLGGPVVDAVDERSLTVAWALLFNIPRYAIGLSIESLADETDGELDFCGLRYGSHFHGARYLFGVLSKQHTRWSDVKRFRGSSFCLTSTKPVAVQLDGDYAGRLPMEIKVEPRRVTLRLPVGLKRR